jgi:hypothetical protein
MPMPAVAKPEKTLKGKEGINKHHLHMFRETESILPGDVQPKTAYSTTFGRCVSNLYKVSSLTSEIDLTQMNRPFGAGPSFLMLSIPSNK